MKAGPYCIQALVADRFALDGGSMFGNVPRALWERRHPPDAHNRIPLVARVLLAEGEGRRILVDTGTGHLWSQKEAGFYGLPAGEEPGVVLALRARGIDPEEITDVILTHLHFDHAGGVTRRGQGGEPTPSFPRAAVHLQAANLATARNPNGRERRSYLRRHFEPLLSGALVLHKGAGEILPEVFVRRCDGHTTGLQTVRFGNGPGSVVFPADQIPLATHIPLPWTMGYDLCVRTLMEEKRQLLEEVCREDWLLVFEHDAATAACRVIRDEGGFKAGERLGEWPGEASWQANSPKCEGGRNDEDL